MKPYELGSARSLLQTIESREASTPDSEPCCGIGALPATNNRIEGSINARLRAMLRDHRGLSIERRIKAVFWWCYMHSPEPLSASEILKTMPTDKAISDIYRRMSNKKKNEGSIPMWGDAIVWNELHRSSDYPVYWD